MSNIINILAVCVALFAFMPIEEQDVSLFGAPYVLVYSIGITIILLSLLIMKIITEKEKI